MEQESKKILTQADWEKKDGLRSQLQQKSAEGPIDFGAFLETCGFSRYIEDIRFCKFDFHNFSLTHLQFNECDFTGCDFRHTSLSHVQLLKSNFTKTKWVDTTWNNIFFNSANFFHSEIIHSRLQDVLIKNSTLSGSYWNHSLLGHLQIYNSVFNESVFYSSSIYECSMSHVELGDVLLICNSGEFLQTNCKLNSTNRPIVGLAWDFLQRGHFSPYIDEALRDNGTLVLKIEMQLRDVDVDCLKDEVIDSLKVRTGFNPANIAEKLFFEISRKAQIAKIVEKATLLLDYCDALVVPGGDDIESELYVDCSGSFKQRDYRRSIMEISLLMHAHKQKMPVMGICRGCQMINIYFGGTLKELAVMEKGWQYLTLSRSSKKEEIQKLIGGDILPALSMHHQASNKIGESLEIVFEREGIPKLLISHDGLFIGVQFHPEAYLVNELLNGPVEAVYNKCIYQLFISKILQYQIKGV